jgi:hypothetical protein
MATNPYCYKIQRVSDGLYSTGGSSIRFSKNGKVWRTVGQLKNHLNLFKNWKTKKIKLPVDYQGCQVVTFKMVEGLMTPLESLVSVMNI